MNNYEANAKAAQSRLSDSISQNVSFLVSQLIQQAEVFPDWEGELHQLCSIEAIQENQYRLYRDDADCVHIVEVVSIDKDDEDCEDFWVIKPSDLASENVDDIRQYLQEFCPKWNTCFTLLDEGEEAELYDVEICEYWLVDRYAKSQLESVGEQVVDVFDLLVWCRTIRGQPYWYDGCMQKLGRQYLAEQNP